MQLLGTGHQRAAKTSKITVSGDPNGLAYASWSVDVSVQDVDTTNFESYIAGASPVAASYVEGISGPMSASWKCGGLWDVGTNPYGQPPGFYPRDDLQSLTFLDSQTDPGIDWAFTYARVRGSTNGGAVTQGVTFDASGLNQGTFAFPSGND